MRKNKKGFTLVEMMISIAVIAILSVIMMVSYGSIGKKNKVEMAAQNLASDIRKAQSLALSNKNEMGGHGKWGIFLETSVSDKYILFTDISSNNKRKSNGNEDFLTINLPENVKIFSLSSVINTDETHILYLPPDPTVLINNDSTNSDVTITLSNLNNGNKKKIIVNKFGLVDVLN